MLKLIVPYKYLHQLMAASTTLVSLRVTLIYPTIEFKNPDIMAYVESCNTCMGYKGNYTKCLNYVRDIANKR